MQPSEEARGCGLADRFLRAGNEGCLRGLCVGVVPFENELAVEWPDRFAVVSILKGDRPWASDATAGRRPLRRPRSFALVPAGVRLVFGCEGSAEAIGIAVDARDIGAIAGAHAIGRGEPVVDLWHPHAADLMRILRHEFGKAAGRLDPVSQNLALLLLRLLARCDPGAGGIAPRTLDPAQIALVDAFLEENIESPNLVAPLGRALGIAQGRLTRIFSQTFGVTPSRYVQERRIAKVRALLEETDMPLAEIALETGFSSQAHMSERFHHLVGCPPGLYRRRHCGAPGAGMADGEATPQRVQDPVKVADV